MSTTIGTLDDIRLSTSLIEQPELLDFEQLQQHHYDIIAAEYEAHYSDAASTEYRRRFIYDRCLPVLTSRESEYSMLCVAAAKRRTISLHTARR